MQRGVLSSDGSSSAPKTRGSSELPKIGELEDFVNDWIVLLPSPTVPALEINPAQNVTPRLRCESNIERRKSALSVACHNEPPNGRPYKKYDLSFSADLMWKK